MASVNSDVAAFGTVRRGRLYIHNRRQFDQDVSRFRDETRVEIEVSRLLATRSVEQNAWYWSGIVNRIIAHGDNAYTANEMHEFLKAKFLPKKLAFCDGNGVVVDEYVIGGSTRRLNKIDFSDYCEETRRWAAETLGIDIPNPDPHWRTADEEAGYGAGV